MIKDKSKNIHSIAKIVGLIFFVCVPHYALGDLVITEIMYDPRAGDSDREWIEVYNTGNTAVSLTQYKTHINGKDHPIIKALEGDIAPYGYAIIARSRDAFVTEYGASGVPLYTSNFSLPNNGAYISFVDNIGHDVGGALYSSDSGGHNDGNSLQRSAGSKNFSPHIPSPGGDIQTPIVVAARVSHTTSMLVSTIQSSENAPSQSSKSAKQKKSKKTKLSKTQDAVANAWNDVNQDTIHHTAYTQDTSTTSDAHISTLSADEISQSASVVNAVSHSWSWDIYLAIATGIAAVVGLGSEVVRRLKKEEWDIEEVE